MPSRTTKSNKNMKYGIAVIMMDNMDGDMEAVGTKEYQVIRGWPTVSLYTMDANTRISKTTKAYTSKHDLSDKIPSRLQPKSGFCDLEIPACPAQTNRWATLQKSCSKWHFTRDHTMNTHRPTNTVCGRYLFRPLLGRIVMPILTSALTKPP